MMRTVDPDEGEIPARSHANASPEGHFTSIRSPINLHRLDQRRGLCAQLALRFHQRAFTGTGQSKKNGAL